MVNLRNGKVVGADDDSWLGLSPDTSSANLLTNTQIISLIEPRFREMAQDPKFNTTTGNIAALIAKFEGRQLLVEYSYSTNSSLEWEKSGYYNLASVTLQYPGDFSLQSNSQSRNHTEPKLLQEFQDYFLFEGSVCTRELRWVVIVTDRPCCGTCLSGSIMPFKDWSSMNNVTFYVLDLQHEIQNTSWSAVRTNHHIVV